MGAAVLFQWGVSSYFGWGVYGLNLALFGSAAGRRVVTCCPFTAQDLAIDPLRRARLGEFVAGSAALARDLSRHSGALVRVPGAVALHSLGNRLEYAARGAGGTVVVGDRTLGVVFCEDTTFDAAALARGRRYEALVAGSTWTAECLRAAGLGSVAVVIQGIDPTLFHPAPRLGLLDGRFAVFSGGKLEFRKGQDITLRAFRLFQARHPEAVLLAAWHSPWHGRFAQDLPALTGVAPVPVRPDGSIDARAWAAANGIPPQSVIDLGAVPNPLLAPVLREADAALLPSRCESGTNLVAMEAMACGLPTILAANTGHLDLIRPGLCHPLTRQRPVRPISGLGTDGWGDSDPEEAAALLEAIYTDRAGAARIAAAGAAAMANLTWAGQIDRLLARLGV